jgi:hypothetical protein
MKLGKVNINSMAQTSGIQRGALNPECTAQAKYNA